ncbi:unnamed protein product [Orchesella dallaii]|uniref:Uncharacterized protein n=1 Tax=Orchesella dallaii TaxID=48710 RepID=A0ABP1QS18_9HEXA
MGAQQSHLEHLRGIHTGAIQDSLTFIINGEQLTVKTKGCDPEIGPQYLLVDYLRDKLGLTGTKYMCREGGCGACVVKVKSPNHVAGRNTSVSANSCLLPLFACDGLEITTVEALGNRKTGYNEIQDRLVKFGGTQCGFCSPGFVMNMHSVAEANPDFTSQDVENSLDGNICRCTGFRPILDAFKSLSVDPREELKWKCMDIEDTYRCPLRFSGNMNSSTNTLEVVQSPRNMYLQSSSGEQWFKVTTLPTLFELLKTFSSTQLKYRLVAGNTGTGLYKNDGPYAVYIDINDIPELKSQLIDRLEMVLGGNMTLTMAMNLFKMASKTEGFIYASEFYNHFLRIAGHPVRNRGTLAGNLMLKHAHREFSSDVFLLLESIGATLRIGTSATSYQNYSLVDFLNLDMNGKLILSIHLPAYDRQKNVLYKSFKIGKRHRNSNAIVNAAFLVQIETTTVKFLSMPRICYGGINPNFVHATHTEEYLFGKQLNLSTIQGAMKLLENEVIPDNRPEDASPAYRLGLAQSYLYKFFLQILENNNVTPRLRSGAYEISRSLSSGQQTYETDRVKWPLNQPIPKLESYPQVSGEAQFINDIRPEFEELYGAFVLTSVGNATIKSIDATQALNMPGVVGFYTARDIPGNNNYTVFLTQPEEVKSPYIQFQNVNNLITQLNM